MTSPRNQRPVVFGSRKSRLALWQTNHVAEQLKALHPDIRVSIKEISTTGDRQIDQPLPEIGGKGLFTAELDSALGRGEIDIAVHSLKDLPTEPGNGVSIIPVLPREDVRDILVSESGKPLSKLPAGSVVGTSSFRRQSQLLAMRADLEIRNIRGNVPTRIAKVKSGDFDAVVLAGAGVIRLGENDSVSEWFPIADMIPAPGQAAIAATCRTDDAETVELLRCLSHLETVRVVTVEREFLNAMGGGCSAPIAAHARCLDAETGRIELTGRVAAVDGSKMITKKLEGTGCELAIELAESISSNGGLEILESARDFMGNH